MILKRWILLAVLLSAAVAWGQTSVTEVLTVNGTDPTHAQAGAGAATAPNSGAPSATPSAQAAAAAPAPTETSPASPITANPGPPAEPVFLMSIVKPILFLIVLGGWAFFLTKLDKDVKRHFRTREMWNGIQLGAAALAFLLWLVIPFFVLGMLVAILVIGGAIGGYAVYRNPRVAESQRWRLSLDGLSGIFERRQQAAARDAASVIVLLPNGKPRPLPDADDPSYAAHQALEMIFDFMLPRHAEQFELLADGQQTTVTIIIDGVHYPQPVIDAKTGLALVDYIKLGAGLDTADRRRRQSGRFVVQDGSGIPHPFKVSTLGSTRGLMLSGHAERSTNQPIAFDKLGFVEAQKQQLLPALARPGGVVIVTSPPHQGQSTTLYALTAKHDPYTLSVIALEEQFEFDLEGVTHEKIEPGAEAAAINQKLKGAMLREAGVVLMTKMADAQTAALMVEYAGSARFYTGMRVEDTFAAVRGWVKAAGNEKSAAASLGVVISQRLIRKLCTTCRVPYKPDPEVLRKLNLPAGKVSQFYKHSGQVLVQDKAEPCPDCLGIGYRGRTGVFEVMVIDDEARALLAAGQYEPLRSHLRKQKMLWLQEAALMKVIEGETSIGEITRALGKEK